MKTMHATVTNATQLLAHLPELLNNKEEAETLLHELRENNWKGIDVLKEDAVRYSSIYEAFEAQYPGDVYSFNKDKREDYNCLFDDYSEFYCEWLAENCSLLVYVNDTNLIVVP